MSDPEDTSVRVMVRVRLFNKREIAISEKKKEKLRPCVRMRGTTCAILEYVTDDRGFTHEREKEAFEFNECFWSMPQSQAPENEMTIATQEFVYRRSGYLAMKHAFEGFNVCIFAYGQTGSGKTYSMLGCEGDAGISPRLVDDIFKSMEETQKKQPTLRITLEVMFYEIYNEKVRDLFNKRSKTGEYDAPRIRQHRTKGVYVEGLESKEVTEATTCKALIEKGTGERAMAETKMNAHSSRSHAVFQLCLTQKDPLKGTQRCSFINLVDLAGSEKLRQSEATGMTATEAKNINLSLSTLRRVIDVLIENSQSKKQHVAPFRESVLTYVLSDSLGGNSKTQMLATISPHESNMDDSIGTLRYALRAKAIVCEARVNEEKSAEMLDAMKDEITKLRTMLREGGPAMSGSGAMESGGSMMMPEEIAKEIEKKETELAQMVEEQSKMEEMVKEMKLKMQEMDADQQELQVAISEQKRDRFAAAFRNAFLISRDKRAIETHLAELEEFKKKYSSAQVRNNFLEVDVHQKSTELLTLSRHNQQLSFAIQKDQEASSLRISSLERDLREMTILKLSLEDQRSQIDAKLAQSQFEHSCDKDKMERLNVQMSSMFQNLERELSEKSKVRSAFEKAVLDHNDQLEQFRRRKDKYKEQCTEERLKLVTLQSALDASKHDRSSYGETIKAQQQLIREKEFLIETSDKEVHLWIAKYRAAQDLAERRGETVQSLTEALTKYQQASQQWLSDFSHKEQETATLRNFCSDAQALVEAHGHKLPSSTCVGGASLTTQNAASIKQLLGEVPRYPNSIGTSMVHRSSPIRPRTSSPLRSPFPRQPHIEVIKPSGALKHPSPLRFR